MASYNRNRASFSRPGAPGGMTLQKKRPAFQGNGMGGIKAAPPRAGVAPGAPRPGAPGAATGPAAGRPAPRRKLTPQVSVPDSLYNNQVDQANRKAGQTDLALANREQQTKYQFGIDDPSNPFSRAEGLKRSYLQRQKAASTNLASQGQLYSGSHERALGRIRRDEAQSRHELRGAYESALGGIAADRQNSANQSEDEKLAAFDAWLSRAPEAQDPGEDDPGAGAPVSAPAPAAAPSVTGSIQASGGPVAPAPRPVAPIQRITARAPAPRAPAPAPKKPPPKVQAVFKKAPPKKPAPRQGTIRAGRR